MEFLSLFLVYDFLKLKKINISWLIAYLISKILTDNYDSHLF